MADIRTHYDNLKVARNAPVSVIKAAYKALCQTYHPDKFEGSNDQAERIMKIINASYAVLIDPVKRAVHDDWIREQETKAKQSEKVQFDQAGEATNQKYYQRQDKYGNPKTKEPPSSTNPSPQDELGNKKANITPQQNDINIFAILIDIIVVLSLLDYVGIEIGQHKYTLYDLLQGIVLFSIAGWWVLAGRSKIH